MTRDNVILTGKLKNPDNEMFWAFRGVTAVDARTTLTVVRTVSIRYGSVRLKAKPFEL